MARHAPRRPGGGGELRARAVGRAIAAARRMRRLKQVNLAHDSGVSLGAVARWEQGDNLISLRLLFAVAAALDVPAWRLLRAAEKYERVLATWGGGVTAPGRRRGGVVEAEVDADG